MDAIWVSVAVGAVVRVKESLVWWKRVKVGGGVVGRVGYWIVWVVMVVGVGVCLELQPKAKTKKEKAIRKPEVTLVRPTRLALVRSLVASRCTSMDGLLTRPLSSYSFSWLLRDRRSIQGRHLHLFEPSAVLFQSEALSYSGRAVDL